MSERGPQTLAVARTELEQLDVDQPLVGIVMGSKSDIPAMEAAERELSARGIGSETRVMSAHREPDAVADYARNARLRGLRVIIAGAGLSAALPGVVAAHCDLPVIGVPLTSRTSVAGGLDALLAIAQMPPGVPVACVGVDNARNAAVLAARILGAPEAATARASRLRAPLACAVTPADGRRDRSSLLGGGEPAARLRRGAPGRVEDVVARLDHTDGLPPVVGLKARIGGREMFVPIDRIEQFGPSRGAHVDDEAQPRAVRAPARRGAAARRRARPQHDQRQHRAAGPARVRSSSCARTAPGAWPASTRASGRGLWRLVAAPLSRPRHRAHRQFVPWAETGAVRRPRPDLAAEARARGACAACTRRRSPTSSRPPPTRRARRSWRPSATTRSSRPTCSRSSTTSTRSSSCASAPMRRSRRCSRGWPPTTPPTCCWRSSRTAGSRS